jgi:hypothetical protein
MARPAWQNIPDTDVDIDSPGKTTDVFSNLRDDLEAVRLDVFGVNIAEDTHTGDTSWTAVTGGAFRIHVPDVADYTGIQRKIDLTVEGKVTANNGLLRLYDVTNSTAGATLTTTSATYEDLVLTIDIAAGDKGTTQDYRVEFSLSNSGDTVYCKAVNSFTGRLEF